MTASLAFDYRTVVVDPPWHYGDRLPGPKRGASKFYDTMSVEQIASLDLPINREGAHVYLWTTNSFLRDALEIMAGWGVAYKTMITWVKVKKAASGGEVLNPEDVRIGMGHSWRGATEHCLFGVVGRLPALVRDQHNVIVATRGEHSRKPDTFYEKVVRLSPGPRLNMFARSAREGFDGQGDQYDDESTVGVSADSRGND